MKNWKQTLAEETLAFLEGGELGREAYRAGQIAKAEELGRMAARTAPEQSPAKPVPVVAVVALSEPEKAGLVDKATAKPATNWRMKIQAEAYEHWIRLLASGCSPTVHSILDYMAKWCETNNVRTDSGIFPRTGHIKNTVLGGGHWMPPTISREQAKNHVAQVAQVAHSKTAQVAH